jgi:hypothetical protein
MVQAAVESGALEGSLMWDDDAEVGSIVSDSGDNVRSYLESNPEVLSGDPAAVLQRVGPTPSPTPTSTGNPEEGLVPGEDVADASAGHEPLPWSTLGVAFAGMLAVAVLAVFAVLRRPS